MYGLARYSVPGTVQFMNNTSDNRNEEELITRFVKYGWTKEIGKSLHVLSLPGQNDGPCQI